jgi:hypothetical protein
VPSNYVYATGCARRRARLILLTALSPCRYENKPANFYQELLRFERERRLLSQAQFRVKVWFDKKDCAM